MSALDTFLGRNVTQNVMRHLHASMARARVAEPHPHGTRVGHQELEALMRQLTRTPGRR